MIGGLTGLVLSWTPVAGAQQAAQPVRPEAIREARQVTERRIQTGEEAIRCALDQVVEKLSDTYYQKHGGLFVTRQRVERRIRTSMEKHHEAIWKWIRENFMRGPSPVRFDPKTALITYCEGRCLKSVTVDEIVTKVMEARSKFHLNS